MSDDPISDRRSLFGWLAGGGLFAAAALAVNRVVSAGENVKLDKVPKAVMAAASRVAPKAKWLSAVKVVDNKQTAYELDGTIGKDRDVTVMVTEDGKVVEVETELKNAANVPEKVMTAVKKKWPKFTPTEMHRIRQGKDLQGPKDGDHVYDLRGTIAKGRDIHVQVSDDGEILESTVEVPLAKVPAVVTDALKKARPKFVIGTAYTLHEGGKLIGYHFEGQGPKGRDRTISVTPDGKQVEVVE